MKKSLTLAFLFCLIAFSACGNPTQPTTATIEPQTNESERRTGQPPYKTPSPALSPTPSRTPPRTPKQTTPPSTPKPTPTPDLSIYPLYFTTPPRDYTPPKIEVVPLTSTAVIYKYLILGDITFIRRDGSIVPLPQNTRNYELVRDEANNGIAGYILYSGDPSEREYLFMNTAGEILYSFEHDPDVDLSGNGASGLSGHGYMMITGEPNPNPRWYHPRYVGLFDLITGRVVIEPQYDWLEFLPTVIYAHKGRRSYFLDYDGGILYDFGEKSVTIRTASEYSPSDSDRYVFNPDTGELHRGVIDRTPMPDEYMDGNLRYRREPLGARVSHSVQLEDDNGNVIIPFGTYDVMNVYAGFVIAHAYERYVIHSGINDFDILNTNGELLVRNPLGAIFEATFSDAMVVWLDEEMCILLEQDGSSTVIENAPTARLFYWGG